MNLVVLALNAGFNQDVNYVEAILDVHAIFQAKQSPAGGMGPLTQVHCTLNNCEQIKIELNNHFDIGKPNKAAAA